MITDANAHNAAQVSRCLQYLALWHASAPPGADIPGRLVTEAVNILTAPPSATPMELFLGRTA
jgi:hypothetical protein